MKNLLKCDGRRFRCKIEGTPVKGKIRVEDNDSVYLCQNERRGDDARDKYGYKYSWSVLSGSNKELTYSDVSDFVLFPSTPDEIESYKDWQVGDKVRLTASTVPYFLAPYGEIIFRSGELVVAKLNGSASKNYTCDEFYELGYRLDIEPLSEEKTVEISMDEIAEKWGIPKDQLRIKKE